MNWNAYHISKPEISVLVTPLDTRLLDVKEEIQEHWTSFMVEKKKKTFVLNSFHGFLA